MAGKSRQKRLPDGYNPRDERMPGDLITLDEARRIALAAQGFDRRRRNGRVTARDLGEVIRRIGLLQIDYVNVLTPAQYLVPYSRLGPYPRTRLDEAIYGGREFTEQWAHEASIVPVETWPLLRHRMETHRVRPWGFERFLEQNGGYAQWVLEQVRARGPLTAADLPDQDGIQRRLPGTWVGTVPRAVLEAYFGRGVLGVAARRPDYSRVFDLAERLIPPEHHGRAPGRDEAQRELLRRAARAHGVGTAEDLADYYRIPIREGRARLAELVEAGQLLETRVEGWRAPAYLHPEAKTPRRIEAAALLSPFDPVVWFRPRALRLFHFHYRIEIYVPEPKRRWGYYVLPFLLGDRLAARVDLKADRANARLLVQSAHLEAGADRAATAGALSEELRRMADWLDLDAIAVERRGDFARALAAAVR
jgi:uncharacterized protein